MGAAVLLALASILLPLMLDRPAESPGRPEIPTTEPPAAAAEMGFDYSIPSRTPPTPPPEQPATTLSEQESVELPPPSESAPSPALPSEESAPAPLPRDASPPAQEIASSQPAAGSDEPLKEEESDPVPPRDESSSVAAEAPSASTRPAVASPTSSATAADGLSGWVVQVGSFGQRDNALKLRDRLREAGFPAFIEPFQRDEKALYRVRVGPMLEYEGAEQTLGRLKSQDFDGFIQRYP